MNKGKSKENPVIISIEEFDALIANFDNELQCLKEEQAGLAKDMDVYAKTIWYVRYTISALDRDMKQSDDKISSYLDILDRWFEYKNPGAR